MRIARLELKAFGPFTDRVLDFSTRPRALQLVYGPNEAGKSSTLRALVGLLYGIDARTQDAHAHDMTRLRVGATLLDELGNELRVVRRKGLKNTLMNEAEEPIGEAALTPLLGGLDVTLFSQMFGLDHERLRHGAEALLRGGGQLGEVLFDASTGGRGVHTLIESLRAEADALFKARGRTPELNVALEGLREKKKLRNEAALRPEAYAAQQSALVDARLERDRAVELRRAYGAEKSRLTRLLQLVPLLAKRDALVVELVKLHELAERDVAGSAHEAAGDVLLEETVQELNRRYGSVLASDREEPTRRAELAALTREVEELRARLGQGLADLQGLDSATRARVRKRVEDERKLSSERAELARVEAAEREEQTRLVARLSELPELELTALPALLAELEREQLPASLARNEAELDKLSAQIARRSKALGLELDLVRLTSTSLPSDREVSELERALEQRERERERLHKEHTLALEQRARSAAQRAELLLHGELATAAQLEHARAERDAAFDALFGQPTQAGQPAPALQMRAHAAATLRADAIADRMVREAQAASELARIDLALAQLTLQASECEAQLAQVASASTELGERWAELSSPFGLTRHSPRAARPLLVELGVLREQLGERALLEAQHGQLAARAEAHCLELSAHLQTKTASQTNSPRHATPRARLEQQIALARKLHERALERTRARDALRVQLDKLESEQAARRGRASVIERELSLSHARYLEQLSALGLMSGPQSAAESTPIAPDELLACFDELTELAQRTRELASSSYRLEAARVARESLVTDVFALAARSLPTLVQERGAVASSPASLEQTLAALSRLQRARSEAERDLTRHRGELAELEAQLVTLSDGVALDELRLTLSTFDPHAARARLDELEGLLEELSERSADLEQALGRLSAGLERLEQVSGAGELAEDYEQELSHARSLSRRYVEVRLALKLLGSQVERYRTSHQQPVLKRASELFTRLTLRRYRGLTVEFNEHDEPVLSCLVTGGGSVQVGALSDGTRDQLYLALRVASIERYFDGRPPLPLILDDALIHFDDTRAAAALEVLGELTKHTQVLFFTHHRRMVELAQSALGKSRVQLHELPGQAVPRSDGPLFDSTLS